MSGAGCLNGMVLKDDELLIMSGRDVSDFFYQFKVSRERCRRNVLGPMLSARDLEEIFGESFTSEGYVGLSTMAMGDNNACEFSQSAHVALVCRCGGAALDELLKMNEPPPRSCFSAGVVIDDLVCFERILKSEYFELANHGRVGPQRLKLIQMPI